MAPAVVRDPVPPPRLGSLAGLARGGLGLARRILGEGAVLRAAEFGYTTLLAPPPLRRLADGLLLAMLPDSILVAGARIVLDPADPVVSGALALGLYEPREIAFFRRACTPGATVLDVGANLGLYAALAGLAVGPAGRVFAFEPDPHCFRYLERTLAVNGLASVEAVQAAATRTTGRATLYSSTRNGGDHRLYDPGLPCRRTEVATLALDEFLEARAIPSIDLVKVDVQGAEGSVLAGLARTLARSPGATILTEFWPQGLVAGGTDPEAWLADLESRGLALFEVGDQGRLTPVRDKPGLVARHPGRAYTNLALLGAAVDPTRFG